MDHLQLIGLEFLVLVITDAVDELYRRSVTVLGEERDAVLSTLYRMEYLTYGLIHEHRVLDLVHGLLPTLTEHPLHHLRVAHHSLLLLIVLAVLLLRDLLLLLVRRTGALLHILLVELVLVQL